MKKFNEIPYERINYDYTKTSIIDLINNLKNNDNFSSYLDVCKKIISIQNHIEEMYDYADIRNMRDSEDVYFKKEIDYWNEYKPKFDVLFLPFYQLIITSNYKEKLREVMPDNFFNTIEYQIRITSNDIIELQQKENTLKTKYRDLNKTKIMYDGEERTIAYISSFFSHSDREVRKRAHDAINDFYLSNQKEYDEIFYELVKTRNEIANKLNFANYTEYSLYSLRRFGYDYQDIKCFRDNIRKHIIPLCKTLSTWQQEELSLEKLEYYDTIYFTEMPQVLLSGEELLNNLIKSFEKVDTDLAFLYKEMLENDYIDLLSRDNKVNFAITNYLTETHFPVITGNFKNSYLDIQTITHEMGHSFQKYCASIKDKNYIVSSLLKYPTFEIAEMFSTAMELIAMKYIDNIFNEKDYKKYCFIKLYNLATTLPYICLVDEFQEIIYSKNNLNINDIRTIWLNLSSKYKLEKSNSGHINLESGGYFYRQSHIYLNPFYYIDYALSYFGAFAIWSECSSNLELFKEIGAIASYYPFNTLIEQYNMPNPFDEEVVESIAKKLEKELVQKRI